MVSAKAVTEDPKSSAADISSLRILTAPCVYLINQLSSQTAISTYDRNRRQFGAWAISNKDDGINQARAPVRFIPTSTYCLEV